MVTYGRKRAGLASLVAVIVALILISCGEMSPTTPSPTPTASPSPTLPLSLQVVTLEDGTADLVEQDTVEFTVRTWGIWVVGSTGVDAAVTANGSPVDVNADGVFYKPVGLTDGPNTIEVVSSDLLGNQVSTSMVVYKTPQTVLPLHLFWPVDDAIVTSESLELKGATSLDAAVTVNGISAEVDASGLFSASVSLVEGPNMIEITASDLMGNVESAAVVVYRIPS